MCDRYRREPRYSSTSEEEAPRGAVSWKSRDSSRSRRTKTRSRSSPPRLSPLPEDCRKDKYT